MRDRSVAIVLAGGQSTRMREYGDKLLLPVSRHGVPILSHVLRIASSVARHVCVCYVETSTKEAAIAHLDHVSMSIRWLKDFAPSRGPLAAIAGVFEQVDMSHTDVVWTVAGDLPGLTEATLHRLAEGLHKSEVDVAAAMRDGRLQPLVAAWRPAVESLFRRLAKEDERRLMQVMERCSVMAVPFEGDESWQVRPVHTPLDYDVWMDWRSGREEP